MKRLFYVLLILSKMAFAAEAPLCTDEIIREVTKDVFCALEDLAQRSTSISLENGRGEIDQIIDSRFDDFVGILQQYDSKHISRETAAESLASIWFGIPKLEKSGDLLELSYPALGDNGQVIYNIAHNFITN